MAQVVVGNFVGDPVIPAGARVPAARHNPVLVVKDLSVHSMAPRGGAHLWRIVGGDVAHREDGPAMVTVTGSLVEYRQHGKLHRLDGPARLKGESREWRREGRYWRADGQPTVEVGADLQWLDASGQLHREDGPAWVSDQGAAVYFLKGECVSEDEVLQLWLERHHPDAEEQVRELMLELLTAGVDPRGSFGDLFAAASAALA